MVKGQTSSPAASSTSKRFKAAPFDGCKVITGSLSMAFPTGDRVTLLKRKGYYIGDRMGKFLGTFNLNELIPLVRVPFKFSSVLSSLQFGTKPNLETQTFKVGDHSPFTAARCRLACS